MQLPLEEPKLPTGIDAEKYEAMSRSRVTIPDHVNPQLAYLAGALRDGSISLTETAIGKKCYVAFCNSSYRWLAEVIRPTLASLFGIPVALPFPDRSKWQVRVRKHSIVRFLADLYGHPIGKQTGWGTPPFVLSAPKEIQKWYIRGFFDSEGGCGNVRKLAGKYKQQSMFPIRFYSGWDESGCPPLEDLARMIRGFGINCSVPIRERHFIQKRIVTKVAMYYTHVRSAVDKLRFLNEIGSSHPEKRTNLLVLSRMIVARS